MSARTTAREAVVSATRAAVPASLAQVMAAASLQTRVDRKYLLSAAEFAAVREALAAHRVLEIDDRRLFGYESVYFDTPDLALFRAHRQGRRRRWKARTRTYLDSGECLFEVKTKGRRGETVKSRTPHDVAQRRVLGTEAHHFLGSVLHETYGVAAPVLVPTVTTRYQRATFVDLADGSRVTCDVDLVCDRGETAVAGPDKVLVESKSTGSSPFDALVAQLGLRPARMSKYCLGTALTRPDLPANAWHRLLTREFGWQRATSPGAPVDGALRQPARPG